MEANNDKNKNQGKRSTAETDETYNRDAKKLKDSATSSQNSATSQGKVGVGGVMSQQGGKGDSNAEKPDTTGKKDS